MFIKTAAKLQAGLGALARPLFFFKRAFARGFCPTGFDAHFCTIVRWMFALGRAHRCTRSHTACRWCVLYAAACVRRPVILSQRLAASSGVGSRVPLMRLVCRSLRQQTSHSFSEARGVLRCRIPFSVQEARFRRCRHGARQRVTGNAPYKGVRAPGCVEEDLGLVCRLRPACWDCRLFVLRAEGALREPLPRPSARGFPRGQEP